MQIFTDETLKACQFFACQGEHHDPRRKMALLFLDGYGMDQVATKLRITDDEVYQALGHIQRVYEWTAPLPSREELLGE